MDKSELTSEERFLKHGDRSANFIPVDVHEQVMTALGLGGILPAAEEQTLCRHFRQTKGLLTLCAG